MIKVVYVPLDDRPCNYDYPCLLSQMTADMTMVVPPLSIMGRCKRPSDIEAVWAWLKEEAKDADYAILSVDTLVYGNIIHSRIHHRTEEEINTCLRRFEELKAACPKLHIEAFNLVARVAGYNGDFEDPTYWKDYGYRIWRYGWIQDRMHRGIADEAEIAEFHKIEGEIPQEYLTDFMERRVKDAAVNRRSVDLVKSGVFDHLVVPKDDTAEFGYAALDQKSLAKYIDEQQVVDRVMIYPGADEVGSVLFARVFNKVHQWIPRVYVRYSSILGPTVIPRYEDRPLGESIKAQITSMGGICVDTAGESDWLFAVHSPGKIMEEAGNQANADLSYSTHINLPEFFNYMQYYQDTYHRPVALSDVAYSNGADIRMMRHAQQLGMLDKLCAYGGWNTSENTNGMCLAHSCIHTYYAQHGFAEGKELLSQAFAARKIIEDYLFQALKLPHLTAEVTKRYNGRSPYDCADVEQEVAAMSGNTVQAAIDDLFGGVMFGKKVTISDFTLPWDRVHELGFSIQLLP